MHETVEESSEKQIKWSLYDKQLNSPQVLTVINGKSLDVLFGSQRRNTTYRGLHRFIHGITDVLEDIEWSSEWNDFDSFKQN